MTKKILLFLLLLPMVWLNAQTLDINLSKYSFNNTVRSIVKDGEGNTYVCGSFTTVALWSGHGANFYGKQDYKIQILLKLQVEI